MDEKRNLDFEIFFDNLITKGQIEKTKEVVPGLTVTVRPLSAEEQIEAESVMIAANPMVPFDTIEQVRSIHTLARAIVAINDVKIYLNEIDAEGQKENEKRRKALHGKLNKLPGIVINKIYELYSEVVKEQDELFYPPEDEEKLVDKLENF